MHRSYLWWDNAKYKIMLKTVWRWDSVRHAHKDRLDSLPHPPSERRWAFTHERIGAIISAYSLLLIVRSTHDFGVSCKRTTWECMGVAGTPWIIQASIKVNG